MKSLTVAMKLGLGFAVVLALMAILGVFSLRQMSSINQQSTDMAQNWMPSVRWTEEINGNTADYRVAELQHVLADTPAAMQKYEKDMADLMATITKNRAIYEKMISSPEEKAIYDNFSKKFDAYMVEHEKLIPLSRAMKTKEATALLNGESQKLYDEYSALAMQLVDINVKGGNDASDAGDVMYAAAQKLVIGMIVISILIGIGIAFVITRGLTRQLGGEPGYAAEMVSRIAAGDLTVNVQTKANDSSSMLFAIKGMVQRLSGIIGEVRGSADALSSASEEVSATAQSMSQATSEQAASVEETSASVEQMSASINQNTENAKVTDGMASQAAKASR